MSLADIIRINPGTINQVNDVLIGTAGTPYGPLRSHFQGQLGKWFDLDDSDIVYASSVGTVYGGRFQYVRLAAASAVPVLGQIAFWDTTVANNLYQVTCDEDLSSNAQSIMIAGIFLNPSLTAGNYTVIQVLGNVKVQYRGTLTAAGAIGSPVYAATSGGADEGFADVLTTDSTAAINATFLGKAVDIPVGGSAGVISLMPQLRMF